MSPTCSFCDQPIKDGELVIVSKEATIKLHGDHFELTHSEKPCTLSHEDCWEGRKRPFPARRRVIQIGGINE